MGRAPCYFLFCVREECIFVVVVVAVVRSLSSIHLESGGLLCIHWTL